MFFLRFSRTRFLIPHFSSFYFHLACLYYLFTGCLSWHCRVEPKAKDRIPGMKYDTLMPEDIEPYLNGRSWEDLKVGDEIAFPESDGSAPTGESLVGLNWTLGEEKGTFATFDAKTGMHTLEGGPPDPINLRDLPDDIKSKLSFEGSDTYFASDLLGLCTIGELGV